MTDPLEPSRRLRAHLRVEIRLLNLQLRRMNSFDVARPLVEAELNALFSKLVDVEQRLHKQRKRAPGLGPLNGEARHPGGDAQPADTQGFPSRHSSRGGAEIFAESLVEAPKSAAGARQ